MIFQETTRTRRLVGRIEEGEDLVEVLTNLCEEHDVRAGQIQALGSLSQAEIARFDPKSGSYQTSFDAEGDFELISLSGNVSRLGDEVVLRLEVLLSAMGPAGPQVLSGQLRAAESVSCEFVLEIFEDLAVDRRLDSDTGRLTVKAIRRTQKAAPAPEQPRRPEEAERVERPPAPEEPAEVEEPAEAEQQKPIAGRGMSWKDAAGESEEVSGEDKRGQAPGRSRSASEPSAEDIYGGLDFDEPLMEPGDVLEHPKLGRCRVMKVEEGDYVHVRLPRGRIRKLSLEIVDVEFDREEDGRRIYKASVGR